MAVRNFWLEANIDGATSQLKGGPRSKDGGMDVTIRVRDNGESREAVSILCREIDGRLRVIIRPNTLACPIELEYER